MKKSQAKTMLIFFSLFMIFSFIGYAVTTVLITPTDNSVDDDGFLDLRGSCIPTSANSYDGTTQWNITNATLWTNVDGIWKANKTINLNETSVPSNDTYLFNFTNVVNMTAEGTYQWNLECTETNSSNPTNFSTSFAGNYTIKVQYARPTVTTLAPADGTYDLDGHAITVNCSASPSGDWNISSISLMTNVNGNWGINETFNPVEQSGVTVVRGFVLNGFGNASKHPSPSRSNKVPEITCQFVYIKDLRDVVAQHLIHIPSKPSVSLLDTIKNAAGNRKCAPALQHIAQAEASIRGVCEFLADNHFDGVYFNDKVYKNNNVFFVQEENPKLILLITIERS